MADRTVIREWLHYLAPVAAGLWLLCTSLSEPFPDLGIWNGKRLAQLWLFPLLMAAPLLHTGIRNGVAGALHELRFPVTPGILAFLCLGVVSSLRLDHPGYPLAEVALFFLLGLGILAIAGSRRALGERFDRVTLGLLTLTVTAVYCLEWAAVAAYLASGAQYSYQEALIRFGHPRMYNQVQTWTLPLLALLPVAFPNRRGLRWLTPVLIGLQWQIILTTAARGSIISLVLAATCIALLAPARRKAWLRHHLLGLLVGMALYGAMAGFLRLAQPGLNQFVSQSAGRELTSSSGRSYLWRLALEDTADHPLLGSGPSMYACDSPYPIAGHPHSFPLQVMAEWGLPAFLLLGAMTAVLLLRLLRGVWRWNRAGLAGDGLTRSCLAISILAACIHALVSGIAVAPASQVAGMLVLGWQLGLPAKDEKERRTSRAATPSATVALLLAGLLAATGLLAFAHAELRNLETRTEYAVRYGVAAPRFWREGRVCLYRHATDGD